MADLCNLSCSIIKHFGAKIINKSFDELDIILNKNYKNIVLFLLDGMGIENLEEHFGNEGLFLENVKARLTSVFPPTTVAATTSLQTGLYPSQHAWLGWTNYYEKIDKRITVFLNEDADTKEKIPDMSVAGTYTPYISFTEQIRNAGGDALSIGKFGELKTEELDEILNELKKRILEAENKNFTYIYWPQPDHYMHEFGCDSKEVKEEILYLQDKINDLLEELGNDTLVLITADHGQINSKKHLIDDYPDIFDLLKRRPTIESRCLSLFVKDGKKDEFAAVFKKHFGDSYKLLTKQEAIDTELFGPNENAHKEFQSMLGDYIAVAQTEETIFISEDEMNALLGAHAGGMSKEKNIALIALEGRKAI